MEVRWSEHTGLLLTHTVHLHSLSFHSALVDWSAARRAADLKFHVFVP
jgi:hypothetical protein